MNAGSRIRLLREAAGLSQVPVAHAVGKSQAWLSLRESGNIQPTEQETKDIEAAIVRLGRERARRLDMVMEGICAPEINPTAA